MHNFRKISVSIVILVVIVAAGVVYDKYQPNTPTQKVTKLPRIQNSAERIKKNSIIRECSKASTQQVSLELNDKLVWSKHPAQLMESEKAQILNSGKHTGDKAISLYDLLPADTNVHSMVLLACGDAKKMISISEFKADKGKYIFVLNKRGSLKLLDRDGDGYTKRRLLKSIYKISLYQ